MEASGIAFMAPQREHVLEDLDRLGNWLCGYTIPGGDWAATRCDCKFGGPSANGGEQTGCPEVRTSYRVIAAMTDDEFQEFAARAATGRSGVTAAAAAGEPTDGEQPSETTDTPHHIYAHRQPCCPICWREEYGVEAAQMDTDEWHECVFCGISTGAGLYVMLEDPDRAPNPTLAAS